MIRGPLLTAWAAVLILPAGLWAQPADREAGRPFILWTDEDVAAIRRKIATEPWADRAMAKLAEGDPATRRTVDNLFLYRVLGDKSVVPVETRLLQDFIGNPPYVKDPWDWRWHHVDHHEYALRYDVLAGELTPGERRALDATFRRLAVWGIKEERLRGWEGYPRMASHSISALVTRDKRIIEGMFECPGGVKAHFDAMVDGHFTTGAGNPQHMLLGHLLLWCRAVERLGMNELGFGYKSPRGIGMREFLEGIIRMGDPRVDLPGGMPFYGRTALSHSFAGGGMGFGVPVPPGLGDLVRAPIVIGYLADGTGGWGRWSGGAGEKHYDIFHSGGARMHLDLALELAHQKWPDAGSDYFLAQMRAPGDEKYWPSLYWGLDPIDPSAVRPPPVASAVFPHRGVAILRAQEGPAYWASPAPMAALQMAVAAGRGTAGSYLSILAFHALNRPLYRNERVAGRFGPEHVWTSSARSHSTVAVDNLVLDKVIRDGRQEMDCVWPRPVGVLPVRSALGPLVKFAAVRARPCTVTVVGAEGEARQEPRALYPGVDMERGLMLTREYLFDAFRVASAAPRAYHWLVHAYGEAVPDRPQDWQETKDLDESLGDPSQDHLWNFEDQRTAAVGAGTWSLTALQTCALADPARSRLGPAWYGRRVGVRMTMLGEEGTTAYFARTPGVVERPAVPPRPKPEEKYRLPPRRGDYDAVDKGITEIEILPEEGEPAPLPRPLEPKPSDKPPPPPQVLRETGGVSIVAARRCPATVFVALHEPFEGGRWAVETFRRIQQTPRALAVAVIGRRGSPVNDRLLLRLGDSPDEAVTLAGDGESFSFADHAFIRIGPDKVEASGDLRAFKVKVRGRPTLVLNGKPAPADAAGGYLTFVAK